MTKTNAPILALCLVMTLLFAFSLVTRSAHADPTNVPSTVATTSIAAVSATPILVFATSTCSTRVITTTNLDGIRIGFSDKQGFVPSATQGIWQAASTTVAYDGAQYGCAAVRIYSGATQTITVQEAR